MMYVYIFEFNIHFENCLVCIRTLDLDQHPDLDPDINQFPDMNPDHDIEPNHNLGINLDSDHDSAPNQDLEPLIFLNVKFFIKNDNYKFY